MVEKIYQKAVAMFKLDKNLLTLCFLAISILLVCSQDEQTDAEKEQNCDYLDSVRANFTACCTYPLFVIWTWQFDNCAQKCADNGQSGQRCCTLPCCFYAIGALIENKNADGSPAAATISAAGLTYSFMLSVGNDTQWTPVITDTSNRCIAQYDGKGVQLDCDVIPMSLYDVIDCEYSQNYLKCPTWNPNGIAACQYTYQFVKLCFADRVESHSTMNFD